MNGATNGRQGLLDAAAEVLDTAGDSVQREVADELRRWLSQGLPKL
jgi:hypothetical protein